MCVCERERVRERERERDEVDFDAKLLTQQYVSFFPSLSIQKVFKTEQKTNVLWVFFFFSGSFGLEVKRARAWALSS